eukprot:scaffold25609_cov66-Phaeocystis_antarctica.AAC.2
MSGWEGTRGGSSARAERTDASNSRSGVGLRAGTRAHPMTPPVQGTCDGAPVRTRRCLWRYSGVVVPARVQPPADGQRAEDPAVARHALAAPVGLGLGGVRLAEIATVLRRRGAVVDAEDDRRAARVRVRLLAAHGLRRHARACVALAQLPALAGAVERLAGAGAGAEAGAGAGAGAIHGQGRLRGPAQLGGPASSHRGRWACRRRPARGLPLPLQRPTLARHVARAVRLGVCQRPRLGLARKVDDGGVPRGPVARAQRVHARERVVSRVQHGMPVAPQLLRVQQLVDGALVAAVTRAHRVGLDRLESTCWRSRLI